MVATFVFYSVGLRPPSNLSDSAGEHRQAQRNSTSEKAKKIPESHVNIGFRDDAGGGGRTRTLSPGLDFESSTSANSITPAKYQLGNFTISA